MKNNRNTDINDIARREIAKRDWTKVHIQGDRSSPVQLGPRRVETGTVQGAKPRFFRRGREHHG